MKPAIALKRPEELLDPALNARLGGALIASMLQRLRGHLGLGLAAYNAGDEVAMTWWKRYQGQDFAIYAEEVTIQETRDYIKRVLRTFGIYRWLYAAALPVLPVDAQLPIRSGQETPASKLTSGTAEYR